MSKRAKRAGHAATPSIVVPASAPGESAAMVQSSPNADAPPLATSIASIAELGVRRRFAMRQAIALDNALGALVRRACGWRVDRPAAERARIAKQARTLIAALAVGKAPAAADPDIAPLVVMTAEARRPSEAMRQACERELRRLARGLPVWTWAAHVPGFAELGLALIVAEAGNVGAYANPAKLWKRLGLAVMDGVRQGGLAKTAAAEAWIAHGYSARRRSMVWTLGDALIKKRGPYRDLYLARKAYEIATAKEAGLKVVPAAKIAPTRKAEFRSHGHVHARAKRYVEKRLLRDLWRAWRAAEEALTPAGFVPRAESSPPPATLEAAA